MLDAQKHTYGSGSATLLKTLSNFVIAFHNNIQNNKMLCFYILGYEYSVQDYLAIVKLLDVVYVGFRARLTGYNGRCRQIKP
jgi:hypothetical protein